MTVTAEIDALAAGTVPVTFAFNGETRRVDAALTAGKNEVSTDFEVENPKLWYPAGYGEQPLYPLTVTADGMTISKRIGLRDMQTVSEKDEYGVCLKFRVNGIDVFAKGADWIPMDSRPETYTRDRYDALLSDAVEANMNCLRVWGGGLYGKRGFLRPLRREGYSHLAGYDARLRRLPGQRQLPCTHPEGGDPSGEAPARPRLHRSLVRRQRMRPSSSPASTRTCARWSATTGQSGDPARGLRGGPDTGLLADLPLQHAG